MTDKTGGWGDAELAALGRVAVNFAELEWQAGRLLAGFITPRDVAAIVTAGEDFQRLLDKLSVIAAEALGDPLASSDLLDWVKASRILADRRNQLTHSFYLPQGGEQPLTRLRASTRGGRWKGQSEPVSLADLSEVADLLMQGVEAADQLVECLASCPEWRDPAAPPSQIDLGRLPNAGGPVTSTAPALPHRKTPPDDHSPCPGRAARAAAGRRQEQRRPQRPGRHAPAAVHRAPRHGPLRPARRPRHHLGPRRRSVRVARIRDWDQLIADPDLRLSGTEERFLAIAASFAAGRPADLSAIVTNMLGWAHARRGSRGCPHRHRHHRPAGDRRHGEARGAEGTP